MSWLIGIAVLTVIALMFFGIRLFFHYMEGDLGDLLAFAVFLVGVYYILWEIPIAIGKSLLGGG